MTGGWSRREVLRAAAVLGFGLGMPALWFGYCVWSVLLVMDLIDPCGQVLPEIADLADRKAPVAMAVLSAAAILALVRAATGSWRIGLVPVLAPLIVLLPDLLIDGGDCRGGPIAAWQEALSMAVAGLLVLWALAVWIVGLARLASR